MTRTSRQDVCVCCLSPEVMRWFSKSVLGTDYPVCRCPDCGSAMVLPRPSQKEMDAYYQARDYGLASLEEALLVDAGHYPDSQADADRIIPKLMRYAPGKRFMDVGAGVGFFSKVAMAKGLAVTALEPNPNSASAFAEQLGHGPLQQVLDEKTAEQFSHSQDALLLSQVLEHICNVDDLLQSLSCVLVSGGVVAVAVPHFGSLLSFLQGKRDMYISPPEHVNYFSIKGLNALFERHGFQCLEIDTVTKVPRDKIVKSLPSSAGGLAWRGVYAGLKLTEWFGRGMIINAYYRKA